jgi:hypothetical protein
MKTYRGDRTIDGLEVTVDRNSLDESFDLKVVSEDGFEWGYEGASPSQLALAILADAKGREYALANYELFMREIVANFNNEWEMTIPDIDEALESIGAKA